MRDILNRMNYRLCGCVRDQIHDDFIAGERAPAPVFGN
jgi:hypothetical protein